ncbi:MAG: mechanosensitive ion channel family protein [Patescibacteria group bacterium]
MDYVSAGAILALLPEMNYTFPLAGEVDLRIYIAALGVFVVLNILFWLLRMVIIERLKAISGKTKTDIDDVVIDAVRGIRPWVYTIVSIYAALQFFALPETVGLIATGVFLFAVVWQLIEIAACFVDYFAMRFLEKDEDGDGVVDPNAATASNMVTLISRIILWALGGIFVLSNLGIEVTSLIAGLGIGGIAIAFALQGILSDLFASFSLYFDRPFRIGDYIVIGTDSGTVERIGIKSTRIRTLQGEELVVSNAELTAARVQNFKKMDERRIVNTIGITYETPQEQAKEVPGIVTRIFEDLEGAKLDRVHFTTFGDFSLNFEIVFYVHSSNYAKYLDIQQEFNFKLMERFAEIGIEFAYTTQVIYSKP